MAENISLDHSLDKKQKYTSFINQVISLLEGEENKWANIGNILAAIKYSFEFLWVGVYIVDSPDELVLSLFQGPVACSRIQKGKGVCGTAWQEQKPIIVPDVDVFSGHIACSSLSKSEIVLPLFDDDGKVFGVLDVDSQHLNKFDQTDMEYLSIIAGLISKEYEK